MADSESIIKDFTDTLDPNFVEFFDGENKIILKEKSQEVEYKIVITNTSTNRLVVFKSIEYLKNNSGYLTKKPNDCDFIILDFDSKRIFYIELKRRTDTNSTKEIARQLVAGKKWLNHFIFCSRINFKSFESWTESYLCIACTTRRHPTRSRGERHNHGIEFTQFLGNYFPLDRFYNGCTSLDYLTEKTHDFLLIP